MGVRTEGGEEGEGTEKTERERLPFQPGPWASIQVPVPSLPERAKHPVHCPPG